MGECLRCGGCCMTADINIGEITKETEAGVKDALRYFGYHRCDVMTKNRPNGSRFAIVRVPMYCIHLEYSLEGAHWFCKIYKKRPNICKDFKCLKQKLRKEKKVGNNG